MATYSRLAPMPETLAVAGMVLKLEAINPTTGAAVSGVTATAWAIYGDDLSDVGTDDDTPIVGPFMLVPGPDSAGS